MDLRALGPARGAKPISTNPRAQVTMAAACGIECLGQLSPQLPSTQVTLAAGNVFLSLGERSTCGDILDITPFHVVYYGCFAHQEHGPGRPRRPPHHGQRTLGARRSTRVAGKHTHPDGNWRTIDGSQIEAVFEDRGSAALHHSRTMRLGDLR